MTPKHPWLGLLAFLVLCFAAAGIGGAVPWREVWPFVEPWQFGADHLRVGPDIPFGMPPAVLLAVGHRSTPRLVACPRRDLFEGCLG